VWFERERQILQRFIERMVRRKIGRTLIIAVIAAVILLGNVRALIPMVTSAANTVAEWWYSDVVRATAMLKRRGSDTFFIHSLDEKFDQSETRTRKQVLDIENCAFKSTVDERMQSTMQQKMLEDREIIVTQFSLGDILQIEVNNGIFDRVNPSKKIIQQTPNVYRVHIENRKKDAVRYITDNKEDDFQFESAGSSAFIIFFSSEGPQPLVDALILLDRKCGNRSAPTTVMR
jgi:hypothetical protein